MLRFNKLEVERLENALKFQYILCYGSTCVIWIFLAKLNHFNTSYVTVQLLGSRFLLS